MRKKLESTSNPIVTINNGKPTTNSKNVAEVFGKRHDHVIRDIKDIISKVPEDFAKPNFGCNKINTLRTSCPEEIESYDMSRDGWVLLVMGYTGQKAMEIKLKYIDTFNKMEAELLRKKDEPFCVTMIDNAGGFDLNRHIEMVLQEKLKEYALIVNPKQELKPVDINVDTDALHEKIKQAVHDVLYIMKDIEDYVSNFFITQINIFKQLRAKQDFRYTRIDKIETTIKEMQDIIKSTRPKNMAVAIK
jgi:Rha family phage regulatory protein